MMREPIIGRIALAPELEDVDMIGRGIATAAVWLAPLAFAPASANVLDTASILFACAWLFAAVISTAVIWQGAGK